MGQAEGRHIVVRADVGLHRSVTSLERSLDNPGLFHGEQPLLVTMSLLLETDKTFDLLIGR
jgi:hypothetical protein